MHFLLGLCRASRYYSRKSCCLFLDLWVSLIAQSVRNSPAMYETWARSLGQEDPLEKQMATHSSILAREIPWTEEPGCLQSMGSQDLDTTQSLNHHLWAIDGGFPGDSDNKESACNAGDLGSIPGSERSPGG